MVLEFLADKYDNLEIQIITEDRVAIAVILNPHTDNNILVEYRENTDSCEEFTVRFATQHHRFADIVSVVNHIDKYIAGELFTIEFYKEGKSVFGGNVDSDVISEITAESIAQYFDYSSEDMVDMDFRVRSWFGNYDINGRVERDEEDNIVLSVMYVNKTKNTSSFKEILAFEKSVVPPIRYKVNYIIVPVYILLSLGIFTAFGILMELDEVRYLPYGLGLMGLFVLITIALLISVPLVRRKEVLYSLGFYNFDETQSEEQDMYDYSTDEHKVVFDKYGMNVNDNLFWYNHMNVFVETERYMHRIFVSVVFCVDENFYCHIPLSGTSIRMIKQFGIRITNPHVLKSIIDNPYKAFETIYTKGSL